MLRQFPAFEDGLIAQVKTDYGAAKAKELATALKTKKWTVDFQIADYPRQNGDFNIPFGKRATLNLLDNGNLISVSEVLQPR